jgi:Flp pilus assembly protein TadG
MKSEKGQSMVEFALILPVLAVLLFGVVDVGRMFHASLTLDHVGREAARAASVQQGDAEVMAVALERGSSISLTSGQVQVSPGEGGRESGEKVTVTVTHSVPLVTPFIEGWSGPVELSNTTVMRIE